MINYFNMELRQNCFKQKVTYDCIYLLAKYLKNNINNINKKSWIDYVRNEWNLDTSETDISNIYNENIHVLEYMNIIRTIGGTYNIDLIDANLLDYITISYENSFACLYLYVNAILENENEIKNCKLALNTKNFNQLNSLIEKMKIKTNIKNQNMINNNLRAMFNVWSFIQKINVTVTRTGKFGNINDILSVSYNKHGKRGRSKKNVNVRKNNYIYTLDIKKIHSLIFELQNQKLEQQENISEEKIPLIQITKLKGSKKRIKSFIKKTNNKDTILKETDSLLVWATNTLHELMIDFLMETNSEYEFYESRVDIWNYLNKEKDEINIYEIKTVTKENYFSQITKAIGQLFYYRYYYPEFKNVKKINLIISCNQIIKDESLEQMFNDLANNNNIIIVLNPLDIKDYVLGRDDFKNLDEIHKNVLQKML